MSGETTVGSIVGFLRLDIKDFEAGIAKATALADHLDGKDVNVHVKTETGDSVPKLLAVDEAAKKVDKSNKNVDSSNKNMGRSARFLVGVLLTVGPALIPLVAATAGLAVGFGAMGAAGVLAIVGIRQEMKTGTTMGFQYTAALNTLKSNLTTLGHTAASGVLVPFQDSVKDLQTRMPALNTVVSNFSALTGRTAGVLTSGLLAGFVALSPLARDAGMYIYNLGQRFAEMMSGPGVVSFGDYVRSVFPHVMQQFEQIVGAVIRLVAAFAPFGTGILTLIGAFAGAINAIPVDTLAAIATGGLSIFLAFKTYSLLTMPIHELGTAMRFLGASEEVAATGMRAMTVAAGVIGALIAVATVLYTAHSESVRRDQQAINEMTDALRASNGALDENVRKIAFKSLTESGAIATAKEYGINLAAVTSDALGNAYAHDQVTAAVNKAKEASFGASTNSDRYGASLLGTTTLLGGNTAAQGKATDASIAADQKLKGLQGSISGVRNVLSSAEQAWKDQAAAMAVAAAGGDAEASAQQALASGLGITVAALLKAEDAQKKTAEAADAARVKMYLENDAAGILKGTLDLLNGKTLSAADAQNSFESSLVNMGDHVTKTGAKVKFTTTSINDMSAASVALRGQLNGQVANLERVAEANGGLANMTGKSREQMVKMRQQIIDNAVAHGVNRDAVTAYIDKLFKIPKTVPPTKLDVDTATALRKIKELRAWMATLKTVTVGVNMVGNLASTYRSQVPKKASANGNIFNAYGNGGFENHIAQIGNGITRQWNEPETGGEAYIPLAQSKRARSTAIWEETGRKLGIGGANGGPIELGPNTIRALGREIAARPMLLDGAQVSRNVDSRLVPR